MTTNIFMSLAIKFSKFKFKIHVVSTYSMFNTRLV